MQNETTHIKKPKNQATWKRTAIKTGKIMAVSALNGAAFTLGGILIGKITSQAGSYGKRADTGDNVLPMRKQANG